MGNVLGVSSKSNIPFICCPLSSWEVVLLALNTCLFNCSSKLYFHVFNYILFDFQAPSIVCIGVSSLPPENHHPLLPRPP